MARDTHSVPRDHAQAGAVQRHRAGAMAAGRVHEGVAVLTLVTVFQLYFLNFISN